MVAEQKRKVILTGFRATGKSSVGRMLAERLDVSFIDMDDVLVARHGEISDLVKERGWDYFRAKEKELLEELVVTKEAVISTGGGAVLHREVWQRLKETGLVVWLTSDLANICKRLGEDPASGAQRPSLTGLDSKSEAEALLAEREPFYREGPHLEVDSNRSLAEVVAEIEQAL